MFKTIRLVFSVICIIMTGQALAQDGKAVWTIDVIGANGLKNTDWGPNKLSDPFVDIFIFDKHGMSHERTPIISDTLNPQWHYKIKREYAPGENMPALIFVVQDHDELGDRFLGLAELNNPYAGKVYSLYLHKGDNYKKMMNDIKAFYALYHLKVAANYLMPGKLKVHLDVQSPQVIVPDIKNKPEAEAQQLLKSAGLIWAGKGSRLVMDKDLIGKVISQKPSAGEKASLGHEIFYYIGYQPAYVMPNIMGRPISKARGMLRQFRNIHVEFQAPTTEMSRDDWMKVVSQTPRPGEKNIWADSEVRIVVARPSDGDTLTVPDVTGETAQDAYKTLIQANMPGVRFNKEKTGEEDKNNRVISQEPAGDEKISWKDGKSISVKIGWYADGSSLYAAKLTPFNEIFSETFQKPGTAAYRQFKVTESGYLVLKSSQSPDNLNPLADYYDMDQDVGWQEASERRAYLPSAQRVTPGDWIIRIAPEMTESVNDAPCRFKCSFIPEFDPAEPNNSIEQAVETKPSTEMIVGFIGSYDHDIYTFQVENPGYIEVLSEALSLESTDAHGLDISYTLYNKNNESIGSYYFPSAVYLSAGTYFIDFKAAEDSWSLMRYRLTMRFHTAEDVGEPNDTKETAYTVGAGTYIPVAYSVNDEDFYRIKSSEPGYAVLRHDTEIPFDINLYRYDANGEKTGPVVYLPAAVRVDGERLVSLKAVSENHGYIVDPPVNLQIGFISAQEDVYEPNDTPEQAATVELNKEITGLLMPRNEADNYVFSTERKGKIYFDIVKPEGEDLSIKGRLLSSDGKRVIADDIYLPAEVMITEPGRYILQFGQEGGMQKFCDKQYQLTIRDRKPKSDSDNRPPSR